jgi:hypothetical protein
MKLFVGSFVVFYVASSYIALFSTRDADVSDPDPVTLSFNVRGYVRKHTTPDILAAGSRKRWWSST